MANDKKDKFELKKGSGHNFDISKKGKRKFDLTKDVEETKETIFSASPSTPISAPTQKPKPEIKQPGKVSTQSQPATPPPTVLETGEEEKDKGKPWFWIVIILIALIVIAWWCFRSCTHDEEKKLGEDQVEQVTAIPSVDSEATDSVAGSDAGNSNQEVVTGNQSGSTTAHAASSAQTTSSTSSASTTQASASASSASVSTATSASSNMSTSGSVTDNIEQEALNVIRGVYGDGLARKRRLGDKYKAIQARVNEMKRQGVF